MKSITYVRRKHALQSMKFKGITFFSLEIESSRQYNQPYIVYCSCWASLYVSYWSVKQMLVLGCTHHLTACLAKSGPSVIAQCQSNCLVPWPVSLPDLHGWVRHIRAPSTYIDLDSGAISSSFPFDSFFSSSLLHTSPPGVSLSIDPSTLVCPRAPDTSHLGL